MKISIASDHGGYILKKDLVDFLVKEGYSVIDEGCDSLDSVDYPVYANKVCDDMQKGFVEKGILICTTGIGMSMCANKHKGIRAALVTNIESASLTRRHNDANVICLGAKFVSFEDAKEYVLTFLNTEFEGGRHQRRVNLINDIERN